MKIPSRYDEQRLAYECKQAEKLDKLPREPFPEIETPPQETLKVFLTDAGECAIIEESS